MKLSSVDIFNAITTTIHGISANDRVVVVISLLPKVMLLCNPSTNEEYAHMERISNLLNVCLSFSGLSVTDRHDLITAKAHLDNEVHLSSSSHASIADSSTAAYQTASNTLRAASNLLLSGVSADARLSRISLDLLLTKGMVVKSIKGQLFLLNEFEQAFSLPDSILSLFNNGEVGSLPLMEVTSYQSFGLSNFTQEDEKTLLATLGQFVPEVIYG